MCEVKKTKIIITVRKHNDNILSNNYSQFYTKENIAQQCMSILENHVDISQFDYILEPSAGTGSFFRIIPQEKRIGLDIDPKCDGVQCMNYYNFNPDKQCKYLVVGNQ